MKDSLNPLKNSYFSTDNISKEILPLYNLKNSKVSLIKFKDSEKQRAVYKIETSTSEFCLKKIYYSESDLLFVYSTIEWLHKYNLNVPRLLQTKTKGRFVIWNHMLFILTPWIDAEKCDFDNKDHILLSSLEIAKMHLSLENFVPITGSYNRKGFDDLYISTLKHFEQLFKIYYSASKNGDKFSKSFISSFDKNLKLAEMSLKIASIIKINNLSKSLCHGDFVNKNILISNSTVWLIDFDKCKLDYSAHDAAYFLRRYLKRENTNWDIDLTIDFLSSYNSIKKLTNSDLQYIVSYIIFPQKYWKLSKDYFACKKGLNKSISLSMLKKANTNIDLQLKFANNIIELMENNNWQL